MQDLDSTNRQLILDILNATPDMTLATIRPDGYPQATTVSFAHDGLTLYAGIGLDSQKAHNVQHCDKVSLAVTPPYADWMHIRGLSMTANASIVNNAEETAHASALMLRRFPQLRQLMDANGALPWPGAVFLRITPSIISVLDYQRGFGHTELFQVSH